MIRLAMLAAAILLSSWTATAAIDTVRVDASSGSAPVGRRKARPLRMFWGAPGSLPLPLQPAGQEMSFEFTPTEDEPNRATMHFRFGEVPGEIFFDDIRIADLTAGSDIVPVSDFESGPESFSTAWTFWPQGAQNTVGKIEVQRGVGRNGSAGLRIALAPPPNGRWPDFHVYHLPNLALKKAHRYRVSLWARANPARNLTIALYRPGESFVYLGGPPSPFESQIKLAAAVGVDFVSFPVNLPWPKPGAAVDWSTPLAQCRAVLAANPKALLLPRIGMDPPPWWLSAHPDDAMVWDSGTATRRPAVVASPDYRRDAAQRLAALVEHLEQELGPHIAGYHPCGQNTGEWFYQDTWLAPLNGYAAGDLRAWRIWLKSRYPDVAALRSAWHNPQVDFLTATIPAPAVRLAAPAGALRDPQAERNLLDFAEFQQQAMAECVCDLAHSVRTASKGRKLVVFFYGYVFEFGAINNGPAVSGHYALRRVLNCPDVDVLCSPISYFDRALGQNGPSMTAAESIALAGKMWLYEDDTSTHLSSGMQPGSRERVTTIDQTNALLVRNTAQCALRNFGTWWMDLGATGWFNDPRMWAEMDRLKPLDESLLRTPRPFRPEVAAVLDEASMLRISAGGACAVGPGNLRNPPSLGPHGVSLRPVLARRRTPIARAREALRAAQRVVSRTRTAPATLRGHARQPPHLVLRTRLPRPRPPLPGIHAGVDRFPPPGGLARSGLGRTDGTGQEAGPQGSLWSQATARNLSQRHRCGSGRPQNRSTSQGSGIGSKNLSRNRRGSPPRPENRSTAEGSGIGSKTHFRRLRCPCRGDPCRLSRRIGGRRAAQTSRRLVALRRPAGAHQRFASAGGPPRRSPPLYRGRLQRLRERTVRRSACLSGRPRGSRPRPRWTRPRPAHRSRVGTGPASSTPIEARRDLRVLATSD